ncbi:MAG: response regulator [Phenylobacterium sp.]|uniref:response regulator n=1 Tax=Phenylobacterium sp. TaxID=1871053 RepID=UPI0025E026B4|nr:response regulator [Phenylobacterium sp.]MCA6226245.1 response regulator [Phenylobacterium sp.]MCA6231131.1 response regulator [Phenylobacterium sp.]MCA6234220.1 response regulator [Phenylobacterium sp.]MCA6250523.1 response regulator [Phenylobacterium sp.]MCA6250788.1 response regulator [Phenylobacterium sp.]
MVPLSRDLVVLVIDDNIGMRSIMKAVLRALGFLVIRQANDAVEALKIIPDIKPDLIITDIKMPVIDGVTFVRNLRADESNPFSEVPIIVATGHTEERHVKACLDAGVDQFLAKPITGKALADRITRALSPRRQFIRTGDYNGPLRPVGQSPLGIDVE